MHDARAKNRPIRLTQLLSSHFTILSVKGQNVSTSTLLGDHGSLRSSKKPKFAAKHGLQPDLRTHLANKKWKPFVGCTRAAVPRF